MFNFSSIFLFVLNPLSARLQSESDLMWARVSPPYQFSISLTCGFAFRHDVFSCCTCLSFGT